MRTALLIATIHGDDALRIVASGAPAEVNRAFKELVGTPGPYAALQLWESGAGVTKRKRFEPTEEALATASAGFKKAAAYEAEIEALHERIADLEAAAEKPSEKPEKAVGKTLVGEK